MAPTYDLPTVMKFAELVNFSYTTYADEPQEMNPPLPPELLKDYTLIAYIDTDEDIVFAKQHTFFGFILESKASLGEYFVALRGTQTILEWAIDAEFIAVPYTQVPNVGHVEQGFYTVFEKLNARYPATPLVKHSCLDVISSLPNLTHVSITGHSLGGAVATLLTLQVAYALGSDKVAGCTFASPYVGTPAFVSLYNRLVPNSLRFYNKPDVVPQLPPVGYTHVNNGLELDSSSNNEICHSLSCYHSLLTYMWIIQPGNPYGLGTCQIKT